MLPIVLNIFLEENMAIRENLKKLGMGVGGLLIGLILLTEFATLLSGLAWVSVMVWPWLVGAIFLTLAISIFILVPLALIRKTRGFAAVGLLIASYIFGAILWVMSLVLTYEFWGMFAVILGLVILGFGIVPIAVLATLFHAEWGHLADLALLIVATFGARALAYWLGAKVSEEYTQLESKPIGGRWSGPPTRTWIVFCCTIGALLAIVIIFGGRQQSKEGLSAVQVFSETAGSVVRVENDRHDGEPKVEMADSARDVARAIVTLEFVVQNRQKTIWGSCENVIFIRDASTNPKVMSVRSKLLSRHEKPSSG